jgi:prepilin-type N-terminal cleavage/methylation domain-containing protein
MRRSARQAFSMIELVIVITIIVVVAALAVPRYAASMEAHKVDGAARRIAADITASRDLARALGAAQSMYFEEGGYIIVTRDVEGQSTKSLVDMTQEPYRVVLFERGATRDVTFDSRGRTPQSLLIAVTKGDSSRFVTLDAVTGAIAVSAPQPIANNRDIAVDPNLLPQQLAEDPKNSLPIRTPTAIQAEASVASLKLRIE